MKKILMLLAFAGAASFASAQQTLTVTEYDVIQVQDKHQVITNPFWSNWFFSVGGGAQVLYGTNDYVGKFKDRVAPTFNVSLGKWLTPTFGLRLQYSGLQAKGFTRNETANYVVGGVRADGSYKQRWDYMNLHGDLMVNLNSLFGGYNPDRVYEVIPYIGAGWAHAYSRPHTNAATFNAGIINRFRLSNAVDLNIELSATGLEGKFDGEHGGKHDYDGILGATVGVTYYFPTRGFQRPTPQIISEFELRQMRDQMNAMAAANMELQQQLADAKQPVEVEEETVVITNPNIAPRTVFFTIGSDKLSPQEEMNLSYLANRIKEFPGTTYTINGYADSATGSPAFNQKLSLKRAQAVKDLLVKKYGIPANNLEVAAGGGVDKFGQPILNRVVLVETAK
ncbi:OmpA family protein [uncultured Bacteroides sp.]|uniref:OmpA family protein n=2 Tax=uncultured Bacteroides sp. TaxID=162156 RepID=UPI0025D2F0BC|nr:OmpA family protein [uncultured Bacteroides sp.]